MSLVGRELGRLTVAQTTIGNAEALVTNPTTKDTIVTKITIYNSDTVARTVTLCRVLDNAGAVAVAVAGDVFWSQSVDAGDTQIIGYGDMSVPLTDTNDTIQVYASAANVVNVFADGFTLSDQS